MPEVIVMITTSYPRFPGDMVGTFMEPIAHGIAARGHEVHMVLPWHPAWRRKAHDGVHFHPFHYAPHRSLNIFGYAEAMKADVNLRWKAYAAAPLALAAGWWKARQVAREVKATIVHGHWVIPGGAIGATATPGLPLVISLHGSDVYVAERHAIAGRVAAHAFHKAGWVTACSADLRTRALRLGADEQRSDVVPYGVDADRFRPDPEARQRVRDKWVDDGTPVVFAVGRLVRKKGFEYLIDAMAHVPPPAILALAGVGDLEAELRERARTAGVADRVEFMGQLTQQFVALYCAAADVIAVPSVRDDSGNVDGLPNVVLEALASATPVVATPAGGIASAVTHDRTGLLVPERDSLALAAAINGLIASPEKRRALGEAARADVIARFGWTRAAERFEHAYAAARAHHANRARRRT